MERSIEVEWRRLSDQAIGAWFMNRLQTGVWVFLLTIGLSLASKQSSAAEQMTFNVKDAELASVAEMVASVTGKNFIIDPRVKGKVTVVSSHGMEPEEYYQVFLAILQVHGFAAVPSGKVVKIVPVADAKHSGAPHATDVEPGEGDELVTRVLQVENVAADQLVPLLRPLVPQQGHLAAYPPTNVMIISDRARNIDRLVTMVRRIDKVSDSEVEVVHLAHAVATEVVRVLSSLNQSKGAASGERQGSTFVADERTNSILISGDLQQRLKLRALITHLDTPVKSEGNTSVIYLHYAKADTLLGILQGVSETLTKTPGGGATPQTRDIGIQADESTNALVITAPPDLMRSLRSVIRQLDIRRAQVQVEAVIAEVSSETAGELGVQWMADGFSGDGKGAVGMINLTGGRSPTLGGLTGGLIDIDTSSDFGVLGIGKVSGDTIKFGALVRALATDANTNILSTPTLVTLDNEEAEIIVGENRPFLTGSYTSIGDSGNNPTNPFQTIERQDVGLTLKVKPQINEGDTVRLDVEQEVSSVVPGTANTTEVVTTKRSIKTSVLVEDGQVIVLGGLIDDQLQDSFRKIPGLGDLPVLGNLFKYQDATKTKRNLMVFLHPRILRDAKMESVVTGGKYNYMRRVQQAGRAHDSLSSPRDNPPTLKPLDVFMKEGSATPGDVPAEMKKDENVAVVPKEEPDKEDSGPFIFYDYDW